MLRSMFAGVSGLRSHQTMLDVVGNNIANVNTAGFKASTATFQEALTQAERGAGAPNDVQGGTNPSTIGLGVRVASVTGLFTQGGSQATGRTTDLAIQGDGFFVIDKGGESVYTRAGAFTFDSRGTLVTSDGYRVQGWTPDANGVIDPNNPMSELTIPFGDVIPADATTEVEFGGNLSADTAIGDSQVSSVIVYDSLGAPHEVVIEYTRTTANDWNVDASIDGTSYTLTPNTVTFNPDGSLGSAPTLSFSGYTPAGANPMAFDIVLDSTQALVMYGGANSAQPYDQNGMAMGFLRDVSIGTDGSITGRFSNGETEVLGAIAMASFTNNEGLNRLGESMYAESINSGAAQVGRAGQGARGSLTPGALEMSNVDLAKEFTTMITAQRGFQANARIITTSDEVLSELVNIKR